MNERNENRLGSARRAILGLPRPRNDHDLRVLTLLCFGRESGLSKLHSHGPYASYESDTKFGSMFSQRFLKHYGISTGDPRLYDYAGTFWDHAIAKISCGGIAGSSYGQAAVRGHRNACRLRYWVKDRRTKRDSSPSPAFVRLARQIRGGKNREIRGIPVLISGREDGAEAALMCA